MASVAKFRMNEAPRLLAHCSRTQKNSGSHIHKDRTELNFNMAYGQHTGLSDYDFVKERTHQDKTTLFKLSQFVNALSPMRSTLSGICTDSIISRYAKAFSRISSTPSAMTTFPLLL